MRLNVYAITAFSGHWPVGTAAVVLAESREEASDLLSEALARQGLSQKIDPADFIEISTKQALVLCNGDY
jgi:hypothetical protein